MSGSLINHLMESSVPIKPEVGMGVTRLSYTDRSPYTVSRIESARVIYVQADSYRRTDKLGMTDSGQEYEFTQNPDSEEVKLTLRSDGKWKAQHTKVVYLIGHRDRYYDFSF